MKQSIPRPHMSTVLTYDQAIEHVQEVFGETKFEFDDCCIESLTISKKLPCTITYYKVKVNLKDSKPVYWPIRSMDKEISLEEAKNILSQSF